jgi:hypothetical protein
MEQPLRCRAVDKDNVKQMSPQLDLEVRHWIDPFRMREKHTTVCIAPSLQLLFWRSDTLLKTGGLKCGRKERCLAIRNEKYEIQMRSGEKLG